MAKEKFTRTKPHVNVGTLRNLGFSMTGAMQIANGSPMTLSDDREVLRELLACPASTASRHAITTRNRNSSTMHSQTWQPTD